ncbi:hypothetical protein OOT00_15510 [Desulfobotulus sp. H1]|uniref:Uncharacterized protein n=1 Tax=Desulfobotulus pelophilus TaxID=2823377 RepID=A0ABT3ND56_9BACT|nr:hypothetical protein [Desulfobotulus pelophilus]MCW7755389.1 hypothetical protein [Desulfobotulus pelophilus]
MLKPTLWGGCALLTGIVLFLFKSIAMFMEKEFLMADTSLKDMLNVDSMDWIDALPLDLLQQVAAYLMLAPLYLLLMGVGVLMLVIGGFMEK